MTGTFELDGRRCLIRGDERPRALLIQPADGNDLAGLEAQLAGMGEAGVPFALAAFEVTDWNRELSPWPAPPVFGKEGFGDGAAATLGWILDRLIPRLLADLALSADIPVALGGYSLAGLFALWSATRTDRFAAVAAASPSVWFPGWIDYASEHPLQTGRVYLSLGDREEKARNPVMATVGDCIRRQDQLLEGVPHTLEWNPGNHFRDPEKRMARAFAWVLGGSRGDEGTGNREQK